jgi:2-iminobutanoate/2-iminopropanoate deaminase
MNGRISLISVLLAAGVFFTVHGAYSQNDSGPKRRAINLPERTVQAPFSNAILYGDTLYIAGNIGIDAKTGKPPEKIEDEIKLLLDGYKATLAQANMTMDDLAYVQVFCSDLTYFEKFNAIYRTYFTKDFPARAFIGAGSLLRGGHFELQGIAVHSQHR